MPGILDGFSYKGTCEVPPTPPRQKKWFFFDECSMRIIKHCKYHQKWPLGRARLGHGAFPAGNLFFSDFLKIFDVACFSVKIWARANNIVNTIKK